MKHEIIEKVRSKKIFIDGTSVTFTEMDVVCREFSDQYEFHLFANNCQNWSKGVVEKLGLIFPVSPSIY